MTVPTEPGPTTPDAALRQWLADAWSTTPETFRTEVDGASIACRGWNLAATHLPGIVLVHGFRAHARWWDHIAPALSEEYRVVALDLGGMGDSDRRAVYSRAQCGREILGAAAAAGIDRAIVVGHSFGALGSMLASIAAPERVARLVVVDCSLPTEEDGRHDIPTPPRRLYPSAEEAAAHFRLIPPGLWPIPEIVAYIARHSVRETADGWSWKFDDSAAATLNLEDYRPHLFGVPVPTDVIYGAMTEIMTPARLREAAAMAPDCGTPVAVPAAHHHLMIEQPLGFMAALRGVLAVDRGR